MSEEKRDPDKPAAARQTPRRGAGDDQGPRRRRGLQSAARVVARVGRPMWRKRGFAESRVITDWAAIVGDTLAPHCVPVRLTVGRHGEGGALVVRAAGAWAVELHHLSPQILERVNGFLGFAAVSELRLEQGPLADPPLRRRPRMVADADRDAVAGTVSQVEHDPLRQALARLGEAVHAVPAGNSRRRR